jgi:hypothetical protein
LPNWSSSTAPNDCVADGTIDAVAGVTDTAVAVPPTVTVTALVVVRPDASVTTT